MSLLDRLPAVRGKYREDADLSKICWFGTGGPAEVLFIPHDTEDLQFFLRNKPNDIPIFVLGVGSNVLIRDRGIDGVVIRLGRGFNRVELIAEMPHCILAGASALDVNLSMFAMQHRIGGFEFLSSIPGTVGGALAVNAGAYGGDIQLLLVQATTVGVTGEIKTFIPYEIGYHYRGKEIDSNWIFTEALFAGYIDEVANILHKVESIQADRERTQPIRSRTGGSTFKNPNGPQKAWELIDQAGCRGLCVGGAKISELHCNFLVNNGSATSKDLEDIIYIVRDRVYSKFSIFLEPEIIIVGNK
ncbi:UDP-N-acetylenolpyruvoylglucosamine reductase [Alphaproteobacteria bacterium]